jgi:succinate dehydrogenase / fumarate reductase iron-sulfur subunit
MKITLNVWRQLNANSLGKMVRYQLDDVSPDESFMEMLDKLNENLVQKGVEPVAFDHDCREGICGTCSLVINGVPHGPMKATTTCQLHMRTFHDGDTIAIEPFRAKAFPVLKDLCVDRGAFDRINAAGGFISVNTGGAQDANAIPIGKVEADLAMDAAACIGCGACVAICPNASAMLFVSAKLGHLANLPQGQPERNRRAISMVGTMDAEGFGSCRNYYECEAVCPKEISHHFITEMNRDFVKASLCSRE